MEYRNISWIGYGLMALAAVMFAVAFPFMWIVYFALVGWVIAKKRLHANRQAILLLIPLLVLMVLFALAPLIL